MSQIAPAMSRPGISVVVCCYNSATRLPYVLEHLAKQQTEQAFDWEVILVNNRSDDNTGEVAKALLQQYPQLNGKLIDENEAGLTYARIAGAKTAQYNYLLFCDDDNLLQEDYLRTAWIIMQSDARIGAVSGHGTAIVDGGGALPDWFNEHQGLFANGPQHPEQSHHLYGAGLMVIRDVFLSIYTTGYPFICEDRKGASLSSGGDTEMCYIICLLGYQLRYDNRLTFQHMMPPNRLTKEYLGKLQSGIGYSFIQLIPYRYLIDGKEADNSIWFKDVIIFGLRLLRQWLSMSPLEREAKKTMLQSYWSLKGRYKKTERQIKKGIEVMKVSLAQTKHTSLEKV